MSSVNVKMDTQLTGMWVSFFTAAGIPSDVSATYALTFTENRIQNDMLLDLNKEYLRDMGITRMGDVIAILRHAKQVHENTARDRVLSTTVKVPVAAVTGRATITQPSSPASRILEHYTRNPHSPESPKTSAQSQMKRKATEITNDTDTNMKKARLIRFAATAQSSVKEGSSKTVFARLGNTESPKISTKPSVKPIYARLGSKSNEEIDSHIIPIQKDALKYEGILKSPSPVKKIVTITSSNNNVRKIAMGRTMRADETPISVKEKLAIPKSKSVKFSNTIEYKEIESIQKLTLKPAVQKPVQRFAQSIVQKPVQKFNTVKTVQKLVPVEKNVQKFTSVFNKPERRLSMPEGVSSSIKSRLGNKSNANNLTITTNVFKRLGV